MFMEYIGEIQNKERMFVKFVRSLIRTTSTFRIDLDFISSTGRHLLKLTICSYCRHFKIKEIRRRLRFIFIKMMILFL